MVRMFSSNWNCFIFIPTNIQNFIFLYEKRNMTTTVFYIVRAHGFGNLNRPIQNLDIQCDTNVPQLFLKVNNFLIWLTI